MLANYNFHDMLADLYKQDFRNMIYIHYHKSEENNKDLRIFRTLNGIETMS